jgi:hypothetical protein
VPEALTFTVLLFLESITRQSANHADLDILLSRDVPVAQLIRRTSGVATSLCDFRAILRAMNHSGWVCSYKPQEMLRASRRIKSFTTL